MSEIIYISRKCEYCHELLILLHKNRDIIKFPVIDIHKNPYPKIVKSVPCMVIDEKVLPGDELFKFINYLINQNSKKNESISNKESKEYNEPLENNRQGPMANAGPMLNGNPLNLNQSSHQKNLNIPGNIQNIKNETESNINDDDELLPGFCVGGVCELGFSSIENEKDISMDNTFELLEGAGDIIPQMDEGNTKSEKTKLMDDDYSRMMKERGNDLPMKIN